MARSARRPNQAGARSVFALCFLLLALSAAQQQFAENESSGRRREVSVSQEDVTRASSSPFESFGKIDSGSTYRKKTNTIDVNDKSVATVAPANRAVRAPASFSTRESAGLSSSLHARSLEDWDVEDIVLLATLDGTIQAVDRNTGSKKWIMNYEGSPMISPMVETIHHQEDNPLSADDDDYMSENDYRFVIEPSKDGNLYIQHKDPEVGLQRLGITVKSLAERTPQMFDDPPLAYTANRNTELYTVDADTGNVTKRFGVGGPRFSDALRCKQKSAFDDDEACEPRRTFQLGRAYYTITIHSTLTSKELCTIKFSEWIPNNGDEDLQNQYFEAKDKRHIYSFHNGRIIGVDFSEDPAGTSKFTQVLSSPLARVFDIMRPTEVQGGDTNLVLLAQPVSPPDALRSPKQTDYDERESMIFVNCTESGDWYAFSESFYPMVTSQARWAKIARGSVSDATEQTVHWEPEEKPDNLYAGVQSIRTRHEEHIPRTLPGPSPGSAIDKGVEHGVISTTGTISGPQTQLHAENTFMWLSIILTLVLAALVGNMAYPVELKRAVKSALRYFNNGNKQVRISMQQQVPFVNTPPEDSNDPMDMQKLQNSLSMVGTQERSIVLTPPSSDDGSASKLVTDSQGLLVPNGGERPVEEGQVENEESGDEEDTYDLVEEKSNENSTSEKPAKKTKRGKRGGKKHKRGKKLDATATEIEEPEAKQDPESKPEPEKSQAEQETALATETSSGHQMPAEELKVVDSTCTEKQLPGTNKFEVGSIEVDFDKFLGSGSNGTMVYRGELKGRSVAVKRLVRSPNSLAEREIRILLRSDENENVVRYYGHESTAMFNWIALELFTASLDQFVEHPERFEGLIPSEGLDAMDCLTQITKGVEHLHSLKLVHRDLKPQNILVKPRENLRLKNKTPQLRYAISDFGLCKQLDENNPHSTFAPTANATAAGTTGWRAPELLVDLNPSNTTASVINKDIQQQNASIGSVGSTEGSNFEPSSGRRVSKAIDIFSLGCIFYYVMTGGEHPFGEHYARDLGIKNDKKELSHLSLHGWSYEAEDLILQMLHHSPIDRISTFDILIHPHFWSTDMKLQFLCDISDHMEHEKTLPEGSSDLEFLQSLAPNVLGSKNDFLAALPRKFKDSLGKQRSYTGSRMLDLLRALRNKKNHFNDLDPEIKGQIEALPQGYWSFWSMRFPSLLVNCHVLVIETGMKERLEGVFGKYF